MTEIEAKERAQRILTLCLGASDDRFLFLTAEIARELQRVAEECEWQREALRREEKFRQVVLSSVLDAAFKFSSTAQRLGLTQYLSSRLGFLTKGPTPTAASDAKNHGCSYKVEPQEST